MKFYTKVLLILNICIAIIVMHIICFADTREIDDWAFYVYMVDNENSVAYNNNIVKEMGNVDFPHNVKVISESSANNTFANFIKYCVDNYDAKHKVLIISGEGEGAYGIKDMDNDYLKLSDIKDALSINYENNIQKPEFDLTFIDASLMGSIEMGKVLYGFSKYFVSFESFAYKGTGFYRNWFSYFSKNIDMNAEDLGKKIVENYKDMIDAEILHNNKIISSNVILLDVSKLYDCYEKYSLLIREMLKKMNKDNLMFSHISRVAYWTLLAGNVVDDSFDFNMLDMMNFIDGLTRYFPIECDRLKKSLEKAIVTKANLGFAVNMCGVSLHFPRKNFPGYEKFLDTFYSDIFVDDYIDGFYTYKATGKINNAFAKVIKNNKYKNIKAIDFDICKSFTNINPQTGGKTNFTMILSKELKKLNQSIYINLFKREKNSYVPYNIDTYFDYDKNYNVNITYDGKWTAINEKPIYINNLTETKYFESFYTDCNYNGEDKKLLCTYDADTNISKIVGIVDDSQKTKLVGNVIDLLKNGDNIKLYETVIDVHTGEKNQKIVTSFVYNENYKVENKDLPDGEYTYQVIYVDLRGEKHQGQSIMFSVSNGKISETISEKDLYSKFSK